METNNKPQIEVQPEDFVAYQETIREHGMCPIRFDHYSFEGCKKETQMAILVRQGTMICWLPKSVIYQYRDFGDHIELYVRSDFPMVWNEDV